MPFLGTRELFICPIKRRAVYPFEESKFTEEQSRRYNTETKRYWISNVCC